MRNNGGQGRAPYPYVEVINENRIKDDVANGSDQYTEHSGGSKALGGNKGIHAHGELDKDRSRGVDIHVIGGKADGVFTGSKGQQERPVEKQQDCGKYHRDQNLQSKAVAQDFLRFILIVSSHSHGRPWSAAAAADESGKGGYDHDDRHTNADAGEGKVAVSRHMADINAVYQVIAAIDDLRRNR